MSHMATPESVPPEVLVLAGKCSACETDRRPRMFICSYHEGWWDGWEMAMETPHNGSSTKEPQ